MLSAAVKQSAIPAGSKHPCPWNNCRGYGFLATLAGTATVDGGLGLAQFPKPQQKKRKTGPALVGVRSRSRFRSINSFYFTRRDNSNPTPTQKLPLIKNDRANPESAPQLIRRLSHAPPSSSIQAGRNLTPREYSYPSVQRSGTILMRTARVLVWGEN